MGDIIEKEENNKIWQNKHYKNTGELRCTGMVNCSYSTSGTHCVKRHINSIYILSFICFVIMDSSEQCCMEDGGHLGKIQWEFHYVQNISTIDCLLEISHGEVFEIKDYHIRKKFDSTKMIWVIFLGKYDCINWYYFLIVL